MRFEQYIKDEPQITVNYLIDQGVSENYIKLLRSKDKALWRGTNKLYNGSVILTPRTDRRPKDTDIFFHNLLNDEFKRKFGWKARSEGVFTSSARFIAENYGVPYMFFPIGEYEYLWSPNIQDIYYIFKDVTSHQTYTYLSKMGIDDDLIDKFQMNDLNKEYVLPIIKSIVNTYKESDLSRAIGSGYEIMFKCDKYILVESRFFKEIIRNEI